jgi:hypothetical protein
LKEGLPIQGQPFSFVTSVTDDLNNARPESLLQSPQFLATCLAFDNYSRYKDSDNHNVERKYHSLQ